MDAPKSFVAAERARQLIERARPLPDRAAVTEFKLRIGERLIEGILKERSEARQEYDRALREGHRAAIAEE